MTSSISLSISGYRNASVPNTFIRQDHQAEHLAILLPGYGYRATMPLLYYSEQLLAMRGADVLRVEYAYDQQESFRSLGEAERDRWFFADVDAACNIGLAQRSYQRITLVGKSIGTLAMGHLLASDERFHHAQCVWLTPLLRSQRLRSQINQAKPRSLFVIGSADGHYDATCFAEAKQATQGKIVLIEGADHSIEFDNSIVHWLDALKQVMQEMESFVDGQE